MGLGLLVNTRKAHVGLYTADYSLGLGGLYARFNVEMPLMLAPSPLCVCFYTQV